MQECLPSSARFAPQLRFDSDDGLLILTDHDQSYGNARLPPGDLLASGDSPSVRSHLSAELTMITIWCTGVIALTAWQA